MLARADLDPGHDVVRQVLADCERLCHQRFEFAGHVDAICSSVRRIGASFHPTTRLQSVQQFAHRRPLHIELIGKLPLSLSVGSVQVSQQEPLRSGQAEVPDSAIELATHEAGDVVNQKAETTAEIYGFNRLLFSFHGDNMLCI